MNTLKMVVMLFAALTFAGGIVAQEESQEVRRDRIEAEQGNAEAQYRLGNRYRYGDGVGINKSKARVWYEKSAYQGHAAAQFGLGRAYANGWGVVNDFDAAHFWYCKAAEQGYAPAQAFTCDEIKSP